MAELRGLGAVHEELKRRGGQLLAVSVDPPEKSREVVAKFDLPFAILADTDRRVIREYGLVHAGGGMDSGEIAIPAHFLIDSEGQIVWRHVARRVTDRPDPADLLNRIRALPGGPARHAAQASQTPDGA